MAENDVDLFVIGGGSGGVRAARIAAERGAKVMVAEEYRLGGTCVIRGCVPKKLFVYASRFHGEFEDAAGFGWTVSQSSFDWTTLVANTDREIGRLEAAYGATLEKAGVKVVKDRAVLADAHTVQLANGRACAPAMCSSRLARGRAMAKQSPAWSTLFPRTRRSICPSFRGVF
jgi:glutathione reductase (NADPH)